MSVTAVPGDFAKREASRGLEPTLRAAAVLAVLAFSSVQLAFLGAPFVNLEGLVGDAARQVFEGGFDRGVAAYQEHLACPPLIFLAIVPSYRLLGVSELAARMPALLAALAVAPLLYLVGRRLYSASAGLLAVTILATNPLYWSFSRFITSNDSAFTLVSVALLGAVLWAAPSDRARRHAGAGALLGLALLVKFNAMAYVVAVAAVLASRLRLFGGGRTMRDDLRIWLAYVPGLLLAAFGFVGIVVATGRLASSSPAPLAIGRIPFYASLALPRFVYYVVWLGLMAGPFLLSSASDVLGFVGRRRLLAGLVLAVPGNGVLVAAIRRAMYGYELELGELRLGWIERMASEPALVTILLVGLLAGEIVIAGMATWAWRYRGPNGALLLWVVMVVLVHAINRGAARYLLYVLPAVSLYWADSGLRLFRSTRWPSLLLAAWGLFAATGIGLGALTTAYFADEGYAAAEVAACINAERLGPLAFNPSNPLLCHCGYRIDPGLIAPPGAKAAWEPRALGRSEQPGADARCVREVRLLGRVVKRFAVVPAAGAR